MNIKPQGQKVTLGDIQISENRLKRQFPFHFKSFILKYNDGIKVDKYIQVNKLGKIHLGFFIPIKPLYWTHFGGAVVCATIGSIKMSAKDIIPFADNSNGDYFCFDYNRNKLDPHICFWFSKEKKLYPLSKSFYSFIQKYKISLD